MRYKLETDICVYVIDERASEAAQVFRPHESVGLRFSSVTGSRWSQQATVSSRAAEAAG